MEGVHVFFGGNSHEGLSAHSGDREGDLYRLMERADELEMRILDYRSTPSGVRIAEVLEAHHKIVEKHIEFTREAVRIMLTEGRQ